MRPKISKPRQKLAREGGVERDGYCHCRRWQQIDLSCRGRCRWVRLKGLLSHVQTHNKQIHINQLGIFNALSCILAWFFVVISVFFHDENTIYPKGPIDRVVRSESIAHFRQMGFQEMNAQQQLAWTPLSLSFYWRFYHAACARVNSKIQVPRVGDFCFTFRTDYVGIKFVCELLFR